MSKSHVSKTVTRARGQGQEAQSPAVARGTGALDEGGGDVMNTDERLARELARVRAKFGLDPAVARGSLSGSLKEAWLSPTVMEENEAEFIDALADCLGAGLPLEAALTCWDTGALARDDAAEDEESADSESSTPADYPAGRSHASVGRRLLVR